MSDERTTLRARFTSIDFVVLALWVVVSAWLHLSLATQASDAGLFSRRADNYYAWATDAHLAGQLHLKVAPRPELLSLPNPYDGGANMPYRMIDLSLYHEKYYFYWGLTPVVLIFAPIFILLGVFPGQALATALFGIGTQACGGWLILSLRRSRLPHVGLGMTTLALVCFGCCSLTPLLATGDGVYSVPIAAAAFCQAAVWCFIARAIKSTRPPFIWAVLAGAALGLSIAARPNYVLWVVVYAWPLWVICNRHRDARWKLLLSAAIPVALIVGVMLALNWARFGHLSEFGMHYQLTGPLQPEVLFSWRNILPNLRVYGWNFPERVPLFPFLSTPGAGPFGVASTLPIVFGAVLLLRLPKFRDDRVLGGAIALAGIGGLLATCAFFGCGGRYQIDYLPGMVLAGIMGLLAWMGARPTRPISGILATVLLLGSAMAATLLQAQAWGTKGDRLLAVSRVFNRPVFWWDSLHGKRYGSVTLELDFPQDRSGAFEPILSTGRPGKEGELLFVTYQADGYIQLGFFQTGTTHWLSAPLKVDLRRTHRIDVRLGSLLPPSSHPVYASASDQARAAAQQEVLVKLDGQTVYATRLDFGLRHSGELSVGVNEFAPGVSEPKFHGRIQSVERHPLTETEVLAHDREKAYGAWRLRVRFPEKPEGRRYDPLVVSGQPGAANFVYVFYPAPGKIAFGQDAWSIGGGASATIDADPKVEHTIEIDHEGLHPPAGPFEDAGAAGAKAHPGRLHIKLDGSPVVDMPIAVFDAPPSTVTVGENRIGGSSTAPTFSGTLISAERF